MRRKLVRSVLRSGLGINTTLTLFKLIDMYLKARILLIKGVLMLYTSPGPITALLAIFPIVHSTFQAWLSLSDDSFPWRIPVWTCPLLKIFNNLGYPRKVNTEEFIQRVAFLFSVSLILPLMAPLSKCILQFHNSHRLFTTCRIKCSAYYAARNNVATNSALYRAIKMAGDWKLRTDYLYHIEF